MILPAPFVFDDALSGILLVDPRCKAALEQTPMLSKKGILPAAYCSMSVHITLPAWESK
jgi:hypothetical protein